MADTILKVTVRRVCDHLEIMEECPSKVTLASVGGERSVSMRWPSASTRAPTLEDVHIWTQKRDVSRLGKVNADTKKEQAKG